MADIDLIHVIDESNIKSDKYFVSLMNEAMRCGLIDEFHVQSVQTQLMELLGKLCMANTKRGNSSMKIESVEEISESVMYAISVRLKRCPNAEKAVSLVKDEAVDKLFYEGREELNKMLIKARGEWAIIVKELFETENIYYNDTIFKEIKEFFSLYDYKLAAHKNVVEFGYPVFIENNALCGAELAHDYISKLFCENRFCSLFDKEKVHRLMCGMKNGSSEYTELPINIFEYVLAAALGCELIGKAPSQLRLTAANVDRIIQMFCKKDYTETLSLLGGAAERLLDEISDDEKLILYIKESVRKLADEITAMPDGYIKTLFIVS